MEKIKEEENQNIDQQILQEDLTQQESFLPQFLPGLPIELHEKIWRIRNESDYLELCTRINEIVDAHDILSVPGAIRQFSCPGFKEISDILKNLPVGIHTRVALGISLSKVFSTTEKVHFLAILYSHKNFTSKQALIFDFFSKQFQGFRRCPTRIFDCVFPATCFNDFITSALISDITIAKYLVTLTGAELPHCTISTILENYNDNYDTIKLIRWALRKGADICHKSSEGDTTPLEYCETYLACWSDTKWTQGYKTFEERVNCTYMLGKMGLHAFSSEGAPCQETIEKNIRFYTELVEILSRHTKEEPSKTTESLKRIIDKLIVCCVYLYIV